MDRVTPSPFETVLMGFRQARAQDAPRSPIASSPWYVPGTPPHAGEVAGAVACESYRAAVEDEAGRAAPAAPRSVEIEDIARELDLASCRTVELVRARRRKFALDNHPDRLAPSLRGNATLRMTIANRLADAEIARLRAVAGA